MSTIEKAPPINQRPKCLACGKRLKPNYDTKVDSGLYKDTVHPLRKAYSIYTYDEGSKPVTSSTHGAKQDARGRWYIEERVTKIVSRKWLGTFGRYADGFFCGLNCARRWAVTVAKKLEKEKRQLVIYKQDTKTT